MQSGGEEVMKSTGSSSNSNVWKFLLPSLIGVLLFITPVPFNGSFTIPVAVLAKMLTNGMGDYAVYIIGALISLSSIMAIVVKVLKPSWAQNSKVMQALFNVSPAWFVVRLVGWIAFILTAFKMGPEAIWSENTGGLILDGLLPGLVGVFVFAGFLLPLLMNFGLIEFVGTLLSKIMRPLFKLPGRGAIDSMASWLGDGSVGVILTTKQYEAGRYTQREAVVVATTFSIVSITFSLIVLETVSLEHMFPAFYLAVCAAGFVAAVIMPRIPPLSLISDKLIDGSERAADEELIPQGHSSASWGWKLALDQAERASSPRKIFLEGLNNVADMLLGVLPVIMAVGTVALVIAESTPIFNYLGMPFIPYLELLGVPEAVAASKTLVVGFTDMFVPSILAASIENEMTRFVIAAVSVTQLIYLSEVGALILGSKLPAKLWQLFAIFVLRTLITLPVIAGIAHLVF